MHSEPVSVALSSKRLHLEAFLENAKEGLQAAKAEGDRHMANAWKDEINDLERELFRLPVSVACADQ